MAVVQVNEMIKHLSLELRKQYPGAPKEGEVRKYIVLNIQKKRMISVDNKIVAEGGGGYQMTRSQGFPDSYQIRDGQITKTITHIKRHVASKDPKKPNIEIEPPRFLQVDGGTIRIDSENYYKFENDDIFLWFSPWNINNVEKGFNIPHKWKYLYRMENSEEVAKDFIADDMFIHNAKETIYKMNESDHDILINQLKLGQPGLMLMHEKLQALIKFASTKKGAKRISVVSEDKSTILRRMIAEGKKQKIFDVGSAQNEMVWLPNGEVICRKLPRKTLDDSMILYFATEEGADALRIIKETIEHKQSSQSDQGGSGSEPEKKKEKGAQVV